MMKVLAHLPKAAKTPQVACSVPSASPREATEEVLHAEARRGGGV